MSVLTVLASEGDVEELDLPGRFRWLVAEGRPVRPCSACVIRVPPGDRVRPAHSHPHSEEVIYILSGSGRVLVAGEVAPVRAGPPSCFRRARCTCCTTPAAKR